MMELQEYALFLQVEIVERENSLDILRKFIAVPDLDPNYRLQSGKLLAVVAVYKDLADMCGIELSDDFYPDTLSLLEQYEG